MLASWFITDGGDELFQLVHVPSIIDGRFFQAQTNEQLVWPMQSIGLKALCRQFEAESCHHYL